jgi:hypothetical protein
LPSRRSHGVEAAPGQAIDHVAALSDSHSSFTSSFTRAAAQHFAATAVERMLAPTASETSIESVFFSSHGRASKA